MNIGGAKKSHWRICSVTSASILLAACGGDDKTSPSPSVSLPPSQTPAPTLTPAPTPTPTPTPPPTTAQVVGALNVSACEQAGRNDQSDCNIIGDTQARMYGVIGDASFQEYQTLRNNHPNVTGIVLIERSL